jgi:hypothetical protein
MFKKFHRWLIKRVVGNKPVIMNVTIVIDEPINGAKPEGVFEKCRIIPSESLQKRSKSA